MCIRDRIVDHPGAYPQHQLRVGPDLFLQQGDSGVVRQQRIRFLGHKGGDSFSDFVDGWHDNKKLDVSKDTRLSLPEREMCIRDRSVGVGTAMTAGAAEAQTPLVQLVEEDGGTTVLDLSLIHIL